MAKANPEGMKWPTDKARYDKNYQKIFEEKKMIRKCNCQSVYNDTKYGNGLRVHNKSKSRYGTDKNAWTCTVCGRRKEKGE